MFHAIIQVALMLLMLEWMSVLYEKRSAWWCFCSVGLNGVVAYIASFLTQKCVKKTGIFFSEISLVPCAVSCKVDCSHVFLVLLTVTRTCWTRYRSGYVGLLVLHFLLLLNPGLEIKVQWSSVLFYLFSSTSSLSRTVSLYPRTLFLFPIVSFLVHLAPFLVHFSFGENKPSCKL